MKRTKKADVQLLAFGMLLALVYAVVKLFVEYWYIVLGVVAIIGLIVVLGRKAESEVATSEEVREIEPQLPPMPYSAPQDFSDYKTLYDVTDYRTRSLLNVYYESLSVVNTSREIETVDDRFGVMMNAGYEIAAMPIQGLDLFRDEFNRLDGNKLFENAARRYVEKQVREISRLKTVKGKVNRVEKAMIVIDGLTYMPEEIKLRAKEILQARSGIS